MSKQYDLIGKINNKKLDKVRNKNSQHLGKQYWRLRVNIENEPGVEEILVFANWLENQTIWQDIEQSKYLDKRYLFTC